MELRTQRKRRERQRDGDGDGEAEIKTETEIEIEVEVEMGRKGYYIHKDFWISSSSRGQADQLLQSLRTLAGLHLSMSLPDNRPALRPRPWARIGQPYKPRVTGDDDDMIHWSRATGTPFVSINSGKALLQRALLLSENSCENHIMV